MEQKDEYLEVLEQPENTICADCGKVYELIMLGQAPTICVSINNGVFLCIDCEIKHVELGPDVSNVQPFTKSDWKQHDNFLHLKFGGNKNFNEFLKQFKLDREIALVKYRSKAAAFYRRKLDAMARNQEFSEKTISQEEARVDFSHVSPLSSIGNDSTLSMS